MTPRKRRQRRHGDLPAGFRWRDGRPRWEPSPTRRRQGFHGVDLKDAWGHWLAKGPAIERAATLAGRAADASAEPAAGDPRALGPLLDAYQASIDFTRLGARTQADYKAKLNRFLAIVAGGAKKAEHFRAMSIDLLLPPGFGQPGVFLLERAYDELRSEAGEAMAYGVMACVSAWLAWCVKKRRVWPTNPAALVRRAAPPGRIVIFTWPELVALAREADDLGLHSIADAVILAVDLSWSQQDLLALTWGQVSDDGHVKHRRIKTGVAGNPPLLAIGRKRLAQIRERWKAERVRPTHVLVCELTGQPWRPDTFRHSFAEIRAAARIDGKQFRDLRDTAVTYCIDAGLTVEQTCSRTLHAPTRAQAVIEKHYGAIGQHVADAAALKLEDHFTRMGYSFDAPLAIEGPK